MLEVPPQDRGASTFTGWGSSLFHLEPNFKEAVSSRAREVCRE
jgi:hypothetical protein